MNELLDKVIAQTPFAGAFLVFAWMFFRHSNGVMRDTHKLVADMNARNEVLMKELNDKHIEARKDSREVISQATKSISLCSDAIAQNSEVIREMKRR